MVQRSLHQHFTFGVERRSRFIKQQDWSVAQDSAGDGYTLALPPRQCHATLTNLRVIAMTESHDEVMRERRLGSGFYLRVIGVWSAKADIVAHTGGKDRRILRNDGDT